MKKITTTILLAISVAMSFPAHANMQNALNSMFQSNVTSPGSYSSATRSGFVGGGITLRTPVKPINLVSFDPPRISAGCGGIDMYGGSFSFINANQFTQLLRTIMNNALGLLFQAALKAIDPGISDLLNSFQKMVQDMNALASNTCAIANQAINSVKQGAWDTELKQSAARVASSVGTIGTHFTAANPESNAESLAVNKDTEADNPTAGNYTWRALHRSQIADQIGNVSMVADPSDTDKNKPKLFMMSLIGTRIVTAYNPGPNNSGEPSSGEARGQLFSLVDLIAADSLQAYTCGGPNLGADASSFGPHSCVDVTPVPFEFTGTLYYVRNMLYGDNLKTSVADIRAAVEGHTAESPGANSIYGKILNCTTVGCTLTDDEKYFLQLAGPIFKLIKETQSDKSAMIQLSQYVEMPLAVMLAEKIGDSTIRAAKNAWNGVKDVQMPDNVAKNIVLLESQMQTLHTIGAEFQDNLQKANTAAETIRKNFPALGVQ